MSPDVEATAGTTGAMSPEVTAPAAAGTRGVMSPEDAAAAGAGAGAGAGTSGVMSPDVAAPAPAGAGVGTAAGADPALIGTPAELTGGIVASGTPAESVAEGAVAGGKFVGISGTTSPSNVSDAAEDELTTAPVGSGRPFEPTLGAEVASAAPAALTTLLACSGLTVDVVSEFTGVHDVVPSGHDAD